MTTHTLAALIAGLLLAPTTAAHAQNRPGREPPAPNQNPSPPPPRPSTPQEAETIVEQPAEIPGLLATAPYSIPSLGLELLLPVDSLIDLSRVEGGRTSVVITPQGRDQNYVFQVHNSVSADNSVTIDQALANIIEQRRAMHMGKDQRGRQATLVRVFDSEDDLLIAQLPARRAYLDVPSDPTIAVTGYTLFQTGPGQFVIFQMDCPVGVFPRVRHLYELMVAAAKFRDPTELGAERAAALLAGEAFLKTITAQDLAALCQRPPELLRISRPAPSGDPMDAQELGYQLITIKQGDASELEGRTGPAPAAAAPGFIVRIEARALAAGTVVDTVSAFYLSADRARELWSITMKVGQGKNARTWVETGIRNEDRLTVKTTSPSEPPTQADWSPLPPSYLSRVETVLLPRLVSRAATPGVFGFYTYDSTLAKITLRRETYDAHDDGSWTVTVLPSENSAPITTQLRADGSLIRRSSPDGQVTEPIDPDRLEKLWKDKDLPAD
ncbi:MAG: hypothetical protein SFZ24_12480 [Planctomycetota bacterium]|nr:hypothetical protein [Planctomycetota bacterium]